jgi:hypothetical protein
MWSPLRQEGDAKLIGPAYTVKFVRNNYTNAPKPKEHYVSCEFTILPTMLTLSRLIPFPKTMSSSYRRRMVFSTPCMVD